jgi:hypothetical protein
MESSRQSCQVTKSNLARTPLEIRDVDLVNARLFGEVDLTPAPLLSELPDSSSNLNADIGVHASSIDLVEALYLVDALSRPNRAGDELPCRFRAMGAVWRRTPTPLWRWNGVTPR